MKIHNSKSKSDNRYQINSAWTIVKFFQQLRNDLLLYSIKCIESPQNGAFDSDLKGMDLKAMLHTMLCNNSHAISLKK